MIASYEAAVAARFDDLHVRFKDDVPKDDPRLLSIEESLRPVAGRRILDLGCGKGRFARALRDRGARVIGLDVSEAMLAGAHEFELDCVCGSARRLPFRPGSFDAVIAIEVFEHLAPRGVDDVCAEVQRVLSPGGTFVVVDKNLYALNAQRPWLPSVAVKRIDEHRGRWMYPVGGPVRERWFRPEGLRRRLKRWFPDVEIVRVLSRNEAGRFPFEQVPAARLLVLWAARASGGVA